MLSERRSPPLRSGEITLPSPGALENWGEWVDRGWYSVNSPYCNPVSWLNPCRGCQTSAPEGTAWCVLRVQGPSPGSGTAGGDTRAELPGEEEALNTRLLSCRASAAPTRRRWASSCREARSSCFFPCWALLLNTQHILPLLRQDPYVSRYHLAPAGKPGKEPRKKPPCRPRKQSEARGSFSLGLGIPPRSVVLQL